MSCSVCDVLQGVQEVKPEHQGNVYSKTLLKYSLRSLGFRSSRIKSPMWKRFVDLPVF